MAKLLDRCACIQVPNDNFVIEASRQQIVVIVAFGAPIDFEYVTLVPPLELFVGSAAHALQDHCVRG